MGDLTCFDGFVVESDVVESGVMGSESEGEGVPEEAMVEICKDFLSSCAAGFCPIQGVNNSYTYKCAVQSWVEPFRGEYTFIQNGAFIVAALRMGWSALQECEGSPNCVFNFEWER